MFPSFLQRLQNTDLFSSLRESSYTYLIILSLHIASLAFFGGMLLVTELRFLGLGMRSYSVVELVNGLRVPKRFGLILAVASGALMFGSQAVQYAHNPWFWTKIALLLLIAVNTLIFRRGFSHKSPAEPERAEQIPARMRVATGLSLLLWIGVVCAGHGPATVKDIMHSMVDPNGRNFNRA